jgi:hypothetical protein
MSKEQPDMCRAFFSKFGKYNPSRGIGDGINEIQSQLEILNEPWILEPNDSIVFATHMLLELIEVEDIPKITLNKTSDEAANALVELARAQDTDRQWGIGAVVVHVG